MDAPANAVAAMSWNSSPMQLRLTTDFMRARVRLMADRPSGALLASTSVVDTPAAKRHIDKHSLRQHLTAGKIAVVNRQGR